MRLDLVVDNAGPTLNVTGSFTAFSATFGSFSTSQSVGFNGAHLTTNVVWKPGAGLQVSLDNSNFFDSVTATISGGNTSGSVYMRIKNNTAVGSGSGNLSGTTAGISAVNIPYTYTVNSGGTPTLTVTGTFSAFSSTPSVPSTAQTVTVSGSNLTADCPISAPTGFEVSLDGTNFAGSKNVVRSGSGLTGQPVTVWGRMAALSSSPSNGNMTFSSTGASSVTLAMTGTVTPGTPDDTITVKIRDSVHSEAAYTANNTNNWTPTGAVPSSLTSPNLKYKTGSQSPVSITISGLNDIFLNSGFGSSNTLGLPQQAFNASAYGTSTTLTLTLNNIPNGTWQFEILSATNSSFQAHYNEQIASGATSTTVDARDNTSSMPPLTITVTGNTATFTITGTGGNTFCILDYIRMRKINS